MRPSRDPEAVDPATCRLEREVAFVCRYGNATRSDVMGWRFRTFRRHAESLAHWLRTENGGGDG